MLVVLVQRPGRMIRTRQPALLIPCHCYILKHTNKNLSLDLSTFGRFSTILTQEISFFFFRFLIDFDV